MPDARVQTDLPMKAEIDLYYDLHITENRGFDARLSQMLPNYRSKQYISKHEITDEMRDDMRRFISEISER
jgi:hypothetical protein